MSGRRTELAGLAAELVALKKRTGLSLGALADRTSASKSAWHRYLTGRNLPPRETVAEFCALADEPPAHLMALWEVAETECSGRQRGGDGAEPGTDAPETRRPPQRAADEDTDRTPLTPPAPPTPLTLPTPPTSLMPAMPAMPATGATRTARAPERSGAGSSTAPEPGAVAPRRWRHWHHWRRIGKRWWPVGLSALLSAVVLTAVPLVRGPAEPAPAPPGCRGTACDGEDSESQGCTEPGSAFGAVAQASLSGGARMEIRHSEHCDAFWARVWLGRVGDRIELRVPGRPTRHAVIRDRHDAEGYVYTLMTGGEPTAAQACLLPVDGGPEQCFGT
ncbi:helix-turn-helix domain-containing protein [Streptomyces sp. NPDC017230]|uniref:helix-turn-helix domain-containing protein n=1 Tax=unclassified Streptomyces TaxID=2593676 RepID=UPI00378C4213